LHDHDKVKKLFDRFEKAKSRSQKERSLSRRWHHIKEEEGEMLPKAKRLGIDFAALGTQMLERKRILKKSGIPVDAEHTMVSLVGGGADTPAQAARRRSSVPRSRSKNRTLRPRAKVGRRGSAR